MEGMEQWKVQVENWTNQLNQLLGQLLEQVHQVPPAQLYVAIAVLVFTVVVLLSIPLFKRKKSNTIVLTGLSGGGKTVLFYQLRDGSYHQGTVTSMEPNEGTFILRSETTKIQLLCLIDAPIVAHILLDWRPSLYHLLLLLEVCYMAVQ
ncbi:hypothetical protein CRG98_016844 [Punica granatum]|uniref:Signal recognition particle receptor subunit beta n=1 Tax=Punica granatum TaxID=22663 RepID=A0A2I0K2H3_PUNGR|nr:hypothetical protein CRG98_016844 [Punica granatum]